MVNEREPLAERADVFVIIAHPDDEIFVSATICLLVDSGFWVTLICATNGESSGLDLISGVSHLGMQDIRPRELELSVAILGVGKVLFLNQSDSIAPEIDGKGAWD